MAVTVSAVSSGSSNNGSSQAVSHTVAGADRLLIVGVSWRGPESITSASFDGTAMTLVGSRASGNDTKMAMYMLIAPAIGTSNAVVTFDGSTSGHVVGAISFSGVDQTTPLGAFSAANANEGNPALSVSSAADQIVVDVVAYDRADQLTAGSGQIQRWNADDDGDDLWGACSTEAGGASVTMSWTADGDEAWAIGAVAVKPVTATDMVASATGVGGASAIGFSLGTSSVGFPVAGVQAQADGGATGTSIAETAAAEGVSAAVTAGSASVLHDGGTTASGLQAAAQVGAAAAAFGVGIQVAGVPATGQHGSAAVDTTPAVSVTGVAALGSTGASLCSTSAAASVAAPSATATVGTLAVSFADMLGVSGCAGEGRVGSILLRLDALVPPLQPPLTAALGLVLVRRSGWSPTGAVPAAWMEPAESDDVWTGTPALDLDWAGAPPAAESWTKAQKANGEWAQ